MTICIQYDTILNVALFIITHGDWRTGASGMGCFYRLLPKDFKFGPTVFEQGYYAMYALHIVITSLFKD